MRGKVMIPAIALMALVVGAVVLLLVRGDDDTPTDGAAELAEEFLRAWPLDDEVEPAAELTDDPEAAASLLESVNRNLSPEGRETVSVGEPGEAAADAPTGAVAVPYTVVYDLGEGLPEWTVDSSITLVPAPEEDPTDTGWLVHWEPSLIHPDLADEQTLMRTTDKPERASVLAADGSELAGSGQVWSISVWPAVLTDPEEAWAAIDALDVGVDTEALAERVEQADPDRAVHVVTIRDELYEEHRDELHAVLGLRFDQSSRPLAYAARSVVGGVDPETGEGTSGLQARWDERLSGVPLTSVVIAERQSASAVETLAEGEGGIDGEPLETTIDPVLQEAAEEALAGQEQKGSIAALRPSTGEVLALADQPLDFARSAEGRYAPGSGFKVITAAALLEAGLTAEDVLGCPKEEVVRGYRFHNQDEFELGPDTTLHEAFTASCNTAFIGNRDRFEPETLRETALAFGVGGEWEAGLTTFDGSVPVADGESDLAASLIGQARVETSPLGMAAVAATVAAGEFHQPVLVPGESGEVWEPPTRLADSTVEELRRMMRATVTEGTASALRDVPGEPHAKTGTAEFATGENGELSTHAWMIGFLGEEDLAFAVLLEDGGSGGSHAGPVAARFLRAVVAAAG
ncbi:penicillin-binding transpeptidase domain-containing protein [Streptomyces alkaliphilus]|uniref:penicillin-binding transpeptidase domain-containing protein n=1 Tax=Streptomyces alkaliphilus TaxID=1472722 RepID=UPI002B1EDB28|nr:penicillin-binding transpeptidase domain-containing protein [Streptomyces alkaliphilus]